MNMLRRGIVLFLTLLLAIPASAQPGPVENVDHGRISDEEILRNAWRVGGATPKIIREVAASDHEWEEIADFAKKSGTIPDKKLAELREKLKAGNYTEVVFTPDTLLEWVWGRNHTGGFALRNVLVQREQDAYRIELADGYVVYLLAKCFNFTLAQRMEATIRTEAPLPEEPIATAPPALPKTPPILEPPKSPMRSEEVSKGKKKWWLIPIGALVCGGIYAIAKGNSKEEAMPSAECDPTVQKCTDGPHPD